MTIFQSQTIIDIILYKWRSHAKNFHLFGLFMNLLFTAMIILFVYEIYIVGDDEHKATYVILLAIANVYPVAYEINQAIRGGISDYLKENVSDTLYYGSTVANLICQSILDSHSLTPKILMCLIIIGLI